MTFHGPKRSTRFLLLLAAFLPCARTAAQAPPGPLPGVPPVDGSRAAAPRSDVPRTRDLEGSWRFNRDESDDPKAKMQQGRRGSQVGRGPGVGWPGGRGGYGGRRTDPGEGEKLAQFVAPARQLTIAGKDPEIYIRDDADRTFTAFTDGREVEKSKDPNAQQFDASWDRYRLVMEGRDPRGNKYQRSFEVLEGNQQLRETLLLRVGRNNTEVALHYVYDLVRRTKS